MNDSNLQHPSSNFQYPNLIIFDCDGTLVDSEELNNLAFMKVLHALGLTQYSREYCLTHFTGLTVSNILLKIQMETGFVFPDDTVPRYIRNVQEMQQTDLRSIPYATDLVEKASAGFKVCVGSNGERTNVINSLKLCGLDRFFTEENIFTKIQVSNGKPAPDLFLYAAEQMGMIDPARCLVIEDSESGVTAGVAAGMTVWGFTGVSHDKENIRERLKKAGAVQIYDDLIHIGDALGL